LTRELVPVLLLLALGCASTPTYALTAARGASREPRPADCHVTILDSNPDRPFDVIGRLEAVSHPFYTPTAGSEEELYSLVRTQVCQLGGDAVVAHADDLGRYWGGPVVRYSDVK